MKLSRVSSSSIHGLKKFNDNGGQGTIYLAPNNKLVKKYPMDAEVNNRLSQIGEHGEIYRGLKDFCAVPEILIEYDNSGQLIGFQMTHFQGFEALSGLSNVMFCLDNKITIRMVVIIFLAIHRLLDQKIHNNGFLVIDFNDENVMFKVTNGKASIAFVDIDGFAIKRPELNLPPSNKTAKFCHPELERNKTDLQPYHDWYSYAVLLARSLIKNDPFNLGILNDHRLIDGTTRQKKGIGCWHKEVELSREDKIYAKRFGIKLTNTLNSWLKGNQKGSFPKTILYEFLDGLVFCRKCKLEVHIDHVNCPKCGEELPKPTPRPANIHHQQNNFLNDTSAILNRLIANGV